MTVGTIITSFDPWLQSKSTHTGRRETPPSQKKTKGIGEIEKRVRGEKKDGNNKIKQERK